MVVTHELLAAANAKQAVIGFKQIATRYAFWWADEICQRTCGFSKKGSRSKRFDRIRHLLYHRRACRTLTGIGTANLIAILF
jgi:hypothetical protein